MPRAVLALCVLALVLPAAAAAGTLSRSGNTLVYMAAPGEVNDVDISVSGGEYTVGTSDSETLTYDPSLGGCEGTCPDPGFTDVSVDLGDGNDKYTGATTVPETINGGDGDDEIFASHATMHGGPGNDLLKGGVGPNFFDGGPGDDQLYPFPGDTVDCSGGGNDRLLRESDSGLKFVNCGNGPNVTARIPRAKLRSFLSGRFNITLSCDRPCAIQWFMAGANRDTKLRVHTGCGCMARHLFHNTDAGLVLAPPGPQTFPVRILGTATMKALRKAHTLKIKLYVTAQDSLGVQRQITKVFTVRR